MNINVDPQMAFWFFAVGVIWSVAITVIWLSIAHRAMRAHERMARAFEEWLSRR